MQGREIRVLLADDNPDDVELLRRHLKRYGSSLTVELTDSGEKCLDSLRTDPFDLLLLDYQMPGVDGLYILDQIARESIDIPVIAVTGHGDENVAAEFIKKGAYEYIIKSENYLDNLPTIIERVLDRYRLKKDKEKLEVRLIESEKRHRRLFELSGDALALITRGGKITMVNEKTEKLTGLPAEELVGKCSLQNLLREGTILNVFERYLEFTIVNKQGEERAVTATISHISEAEGYLISMTDVTERKALEKKLFQAEKLASMGGLVSGVAHELNNTLVPVVGYAEQLCSSLQNQEDRRKMRNILNSSLRAKNIVESLLGFSRKRAIQRVPTNVNRILEGIASFFEYRSKIKKVQIILDLERSIPEIMADPHQLEQVFLNIINNAYEAIEGEPGIIRVRSFRSDELISIEISDNGRGIPSKIIEKIFDPFFSTKKRGSGLGLSLCHGIMKEHGGDISVKSEKGDTRFVVNVPAIEAQVKGDSTPDRSASEGKTICVDRKRILVIDDEAMILEWIQDVLSEFHDVTLTEKGRDGLNLLAKGEQFDILITDLRMPDMGGMEIYNEIKKKWPALEKKMLFITGDTHDPATRAFLSDEKKYLVKPFLMDDLLELIKDTAEE